MKTFSERYVMPPKALQVESMDEELHTSLWICLESLFDGLNQEAREFYSQQSKYREFLEFIWTDFFKKPKSQLVLLNSHHIVQTAMRPIYNKLSWDKVYTLIEFIARLLARTKPKKIGDLYKDDCNYVLERESSIWRFVNDQICPVAHTFETRSIEEAFDGVGAETLSHLNAMLHNFSQKGEKDYRGAAIEATLAVEAYGLEVTKESGKTLSALISDWKLPMHKSLQKSLGLLYSYSNDEIRHAQKVGNDEVDFETAKFMILQCTSYINLMKVKLAKGLIP